MRRGAFVLLGLLAGGGAVMAEETTVVFISTDPVVQLEKPGWLVRAENDYQEALELEKSGDLRRARRKYARAAKSLLDEADDAVVLELRSGIGAVLATVSGAVTETPEETPVHEVSPVSSEQLKAAVPVSTVAGATRTYNIHMDPNDPLVKKFVGLYTGPWRERTQATLDRLAPYRAMILREIDAAGLPRELLYLPMIESEYQLFAVSRAGAVGMWQFMAPTAKYAGLRINYWIDERRDPEKATRAALKTLKSLYDWFDDWHLALAAYNRGLYGVQRDLEFTRSTNFSTLSKRQGLPMETEHYVPKWMAAVLVADNAASYGFRTAPRTPPVPPDEVTLNKPLDLKVAAVAAKTTEDVLRQLNPSLRLWCTPKIDEPFVFRVPSGGRERFLVELGKIKDWTPSPGYVKYVVQKGDVLSRIARRFKTTPAALQRENRLTSANRLRPGQVLLVRPGRGFKSE